MMVFSYNKDHCEQDLIVLVHTMRFLNQRVPDDASQAYILYKLDQVEQYLGD